MWSVLACHASLNEYTNISVGCVHHLVVALQYFVARALTITELLLQITEYSLAAAVKEVISYVT